MACYCWPNFFFGRTKVCFMSCAAAAAAAEEALVVVGSSGRPNGKKISFSDTQYQAHLSGNLDLAAWPAGCWWW
jgi:hypothetical protein